MIHMDKNEKPGSFSGFGLLGLIGGLGLVGGIGSLDGVGLK